MFQMNSLQCRRNLTVDVKLWRSDHDCKWHYTLLAYEDGTTLHSSAKVTLKEALTAIEERIYTLMQEEAHCR